MAGVVQGLAAFAEVLTAGTGYEVLLRFILAYRVGHRPDRVEPRMRKRRPKPFPETKPESDSTAHVELSGSAIQLNSRGRTGRLARPGAGR